MCINLGHSLIGVLPGVDNVVPVGYIGDSCYYVRALVLHRLLFWFCGTVDASLLLFRLGVSCWHRQMKLRIGIDERRPGRGALALYGARCVLRDESHVQFLTALSIIHRDGSTIFLIRNRRNRGTDSKVCNATELNLIGDLL